MAGARPRRRVASSTGAVEPPGRAEGPMVKKVDKGFVGIGVAIVAFGGTLAALFLLLVLTMFVIPKLQVQGLRTEPYVSGERGTNMLCSACDAVAGTLAATMLSPNVQGEKMVQESDGHRRTRLVPYATSSAFINKLLSSICSNSALAHLRIRRGWFGEFYLHDDDVPYYGTLPPVPETIQLMCQEVTKGQGRGRLRMVLQKLVLHVPLAIIQKKACQMALPACSFRETTAGLVRARIMDMRHNLPLTVLRLLPLVIIGFSVPCLLLASLLATRQLPASHAMASDWQRQFHRQEVATTQPPFGAESAPSSNEISATMLVIDT